MATSITIHLVRTARLGVVLFALTTGRMDLDFEQSQWLKDKGWFFLGRRSADDLQRDLGAAGVPLNVRWVSSKRIALAAELVGVEGVEWSPEAWEAVEGLSEALQASRNADGDLEIDAPAGLAYRPYQRAGVAFAERAKAMGRDGVLIGDEMGLGKTMQAIGFMVRSGLPRTVVVCPASLCGNWRREIEKWAPSLHGRIQVISNGDQADPSAQVVILNYEKCVGRSKNAVALRASLDDQRFELAIFDEAHLLKNPKAQRTAYFLGRYERGVQKASGLIDRVAFCLLLTGTPIQNKVRESMTLLRAIGAIGDKKGEAPLDTEKDVLFRYCGAEKGSYGWTFDGSARLDELQSRLRGGGCMVRRLKAQVATELPPKVRQLIAFDAPKKLRNDALLDAWEQAAADRPFEDAVSSLFSEHVDFEAISAMRARLAEAKIKPAIDHVKALLDEDESRKVIVFAHHQTLVGALDEAFTGQCIRIDGGVPADERQALVDRFQTVDSCRVAVLSTHAAGVGLTLTAANIVVFAEADWNPAWCQQAEDRAHRIGQEADVVVAQYLAFNETIDAGVVGTMVAKMDVADRALDRRVVEAADEAPSAKPLRKPSQEPQKVMIKAGTFIITPDIQEAAGEALTLLRSRCDGAIADDGVGFNGRDAHSDFVQSMVRQVNDGRTLSPKQAAWAVHILRTYRNTQLPQALVERIWAGEEA
jgi:SWI/SNF-related matrix-associated actin-dependent regulator 1 of chromatin subfamily A